MTEEFALFEDIYQFVKTLTPEQVEEFWENYRLLKEAKWEADRD